MKKSKFKDKDKYDGLFIKSASGKQNLVLIVPPVRILVIDDDGFESWIVVKPDSVFSIGTVLPSARHSVRALEKTKLLLTVAGKLATAGDRRSDKAKAKPKKKPKPSKEVVPAEQQEEPPATLQEEATVLD